MTWLVGFRAPCFRVPHLSAEAEQHPSSPLKVQAGVASLINVGSWEFLSILLGTSLP